MSLIIALAAAAAAPATPLFANHAPLALTITGPLATIARSAEESTAPHGGTLSIAGSAQALPVRLSARGITRRKSLTCSFPPLRVEFNQPPPQASLFAGQRRLKLVTHCQSSESFQQYLLLEYSAYRLFNLVDPTSFRARLAQIDYVESGGGRTFTRLGFFIEDQDDVARRSGLADARVGVRIRPVDIDPKQAARVALFEYMIGNLDWSMHAGPPGDECCHNVRLLAGAGGRPPYVPLAYDFDYSGLVNAPYAVPPESLNVKNVRQRRYRGYCRYNRQALAAAAEFRALQPAIQAEFAAIPAISERSRSRAVSYLSGFFKDIATDASVQSKLFKTCLGG